PPVPPGATISVINRTWTATDDCGNHSTCVQQITVRDTRGPILTLPADAMLECPGDTRTNVTGSAIVQDACGGPVVVTYTDSVSNGCGGTKLIARTWTATDQNGNVSNAVQIITVRDTTPPSIACPPDQSVNQGDIWTF